MLGQSSLFKDQEMQELVASNLLKRTIGISIEEAQQLIHRVGGVHKLAQTSETALTYQPGIGTKRAAKIRAMTEWALLLAETNITDAITIRTATDLANIMMLEMGLLEKEELRVVVLDTRNHIICIDSLYHGSINTAVLRASEVFKSAILHNAASIVLTHNHPTGDPTPSPQDVKCTEILIQAGKLLDIEVLDHIIFGRNKFTSLKERGLAFS